MQNLWALHVKSDLSILKQDILKEKVWTQVRIYWSTLRNYNDWKIAQISYTRDHANALLTDMSNPFDGINNESLVTNLNVCGLDTVMLNFIYPYLRGRL